MFNILKKSGLGCVVNEFYYGLLGYADDGALLSPSRDGLQRMLDICQKYFEDHGIKISVNDNIAKSKTKCLAFNVTTRLKNIILYNKQLPWVDSHIHLGHLIHKDESMCHDILNKRGEFISNVHSLRQELGDQEPDVFMKLVNIYYSSMYGSNVWDLYSDTANKLYISWNVLIRNTFNLPFATHRYVLQEISNIPHIRTCLLKRFVKFYFQLKNCSKPEVRNLLESQQFDFRSSFGRNCRYLCNELKVSNMEDINVLNICMPIKTPVNEMWRVNFLKELLAIRGGNFAVGLDIEEVNHLIDFTCCT